VYKFHKVVSNNGIVFYQLPETSQYMVLNEEYGYNFYPLTGDIYTYLDLFSVQDLKQNKINLIKSACKTDKMQLTEILSTSNSGENYEII
jgi:hypothetical protein